MHFMCEKLHMQASVHIFEIWKTNNYTSVVNMNKFIFFRSGISNMRDTDFRLFITFGDESVGLVTLCGQAKSFNFTLNDFV